MRRRKRIATHARSNHAKRLAPPAWVGEVAADVRTLFGVPSKRLLILWRTGTNRYSSGHSKSGTGEIVITAGRDEWDQGVVVLHELAHWLNRRGTAHRKPFWTTFWQLVEHFGLDMAAVLKAEAETRGQVKAATVYAERRAKNATR